MKRGLQIAAAVLLILALGMLLLEGYDQRQSREENAMLVSQIESLLPEKSWGSPGDASDPVMPVLQIGGRDCVCLLEVPGLGVKLPVQNQWEPEAVKRIPCRFWGSIYDGSCILGGSIRAGQFDFCARLDIGDEIILTDMEGTAFRCRVERIDRTASASFERLYDARYPLTLFVREQYDAKYIVVRCG